MLSFRYPNNLLLPLVTLFLTIVLNACGTGGNSTSSTPNSNAPTLPDNLSASAASTSQININWTTVDNADHFELYHASQADASDRIRLVTTTLSTHQHNRLAHNTTYYYWIKACNGASSCSDFSKVISATTKLAIAPTPNNITIAVMSSSSIDINWTTYASNVANFEITQYELSRNTLAATTQIFYFSSSQTHFSDTNLSENTSYTYALRACNQTDCSNFSTPATIRIAKPSIPNAPQTTTHKQTIILSWSKIFDADYYQIYRGNTAANIPYLTSLSFTTYSDENLQPNTTYNYSIAACNHVGCSNLSTVAIVWNPLLPSTNVNVTTLSSKSISLTWSTNSAASYYQIYTSTHNDASTPQLSKDKHTGTNYDDINLTHNSTYHYWIKACNGSGCSNLSSTASARTSLAKPPAPNSISATADGNSDINLQWQATADEYHLLHYHIYRSTSSDITYRSTLTTYLNVTNYKDIGLTFINSTLNYWIRACNASGCSAFSSATSALTQASTISSVSFQDGNLIWTPVTATSYYEIQRSTDATSNYRNHFQDLNAAQNPPYTLPWLDSGASYRIRPCGSANLCSDYSYLGSSTNLTLLAPVINTAPSNLILDGEQLRWQELGGASYYQVQRSTDTFSGYSTKFQTIASEAQSPSALLDIQSTASYRLRACQNLDNINEICTNYTLLTTVNASFGDRQANKDINIDNRQFDPTGLWSDGSTLWVAEYNREKVIFAYNLLNQTRASTDLDFTNSDPITSEGIWSDGVTLWEVDSFNQKIFSYNLNSKVDADKDFNSLYSAGNHAPTGIWSNGDIMWVADQDDNTIYAYHLASRERHSSHDFGTNLNDAGNEDPHGLWSDGTTMWVSDKDDGKVYAFNLANKTYDATKDIDLDNNNTDPTGIWSNGFTFWVADYRDYKIYAYQGYRKILQVPPTN